jgi:hypothetical protein
MIRDGMKLARWIIAAAAIASILPANAQERATRGVLFPPTTSPTDPILLIYRASGVRDDGSGPSAGVATVFLCTNLSSANELLTVLVRNFDGTLLASSTVGIGSAQTYTMSTHGIVAFFSDQNLATGLVDQGYVAIGSTTTEMTCSVLIVDAANSKPAGLPLHMVRYNPSPGTME